MHKHRSSKDANWFPPLKDQIQRHVLRGDYRRGLALARRALRDHPSHFECRFQFAKLLGDWADELRQSARRKRKLEAIRILASLIRSMRGRLPDERFPVCLNYYYQREDFSGMVRFGRRFAQSHGRRGHYAQALGASYLAKRALEKGFRKTASQWALRSIESWRHFGLKSEPYYFPHYSLAMALAIAGQKKAARRSLERAARLSHRPISDWEFADVLSLIQRSE